MWPIKLLIVAGSGVAAVELVRQLARAARRADRSGWLPIAGTALCVLAVTWLLAGDAEPRTVGIAMIALVVVLIVLGLPIAFALLLTGFLGLALIKHDVVIATRTLALAADGTVSDYVFATVPLFVLMGLFVNVSDVGRDAFRAAQRIFGGIYGGLGVATVAANAVFAAITGISIAAAAIFTKIAVPEMVRQGYTPKFAVGLTAGSSLLGMLIPPSLLLDHLRRAGRGLDRRAVPRGRAARHPARRRVRRRRRADGVALAELRRQREARGARGARRHAARSTFSRGSCPSSR